MKWLALLLVAWLAACHAPAQTRTVSIPDYGLSFEMPAHWQMEEKVAGLRWYARPTDGDKPIAGAYLTLLRDTARELTAPGTTPTLAGYVEFKLEQEGRNALSHTVISNSPVMIDGRSGALVLTEYASHTHRWRTLSLLLLDGDYGFALTATALPDDAPALESEYGKLMVSLHFLKPAAPPAP